MVFQVRHVDSVNARCFLLVPQNRPTSDHPALLTYTVLIEMNISTVKKEYAPCTLDDPDDFYLVNKLKPDDDVINYMHNCMNRYHYWAVERGWPDGKPARTLAWRTEVLKSILIERKIKVPSLYDQVFGYEPPVKKKKEANGLLQDIRAAQKELSDQRSASSRKSCLSCEETLEPDLPHEAEDIDESEERGQAEESSLKGFLGLFK